jgi:hypothetical protein
MLRPVQFACSLPKSEADALNAESGRIYTAMLVCHYRVYRKQGVWLAPAAGGNAWKMRWVGRRPCMPTAATPPSKASLRRARPPGPVSRRDGT